MADNKVPQSEPLERLDTPNVTDIKSSDKKKSKVKGSNRVGRWFREMKSELKKVVWPTPKQIANNTFVALTVMAVSAVAIWILDYAGSQLFQAIITFIPRLVRG